MSFSDPASSKTSSDLPSSIANAHIVTQTPIMQNTGNQDPSEFQTDQGQDEEFLEFNNSNQLTGDKGTCSRHVQFCELIFTLFS